MRKLQLGDFLWVARERTVPTPGMCKTAFLNVPRQWMDTSLIFAFCCEIQGCLSVPVARELILDFIVERKRMDDLCGSIIDGRFHEQKVIKLKRNLHL